VLAKSIVKYISTIVVEPYGQNEKMVELESLDHTSTYEKHAWEGRMKLILISRRTNILKNIYLNN